MTTTNLQEQAMTKPPIAKNITDGKKPITWLDNPLTYLRQCYDQYGDIFRIGSEKSSVTVLAGLKANQLMSTESKDFLSSNAFWSDTLDEMNCPHSFIGVDGDVHRYQRRLMAPMFCKASLKDSVGEFGKTFRDILSTQYSEPSTRLCPFLRHTLSTQIGYALQGYAPTPEEVEALIDYQATVMNACSFKRISKRVLTSPEYLQAKKTVHDLADRIIHNEQAEHAKERYIDVLISQGLKNKPQWFTPGDIRNHAIIPFLAGIDTVTSALSFALRELLLNPDIRQELQQEVAQLNLDEPDLSVINDMTKINLFTKEIMRLYPPAFAIYRVATNDFEFNGYQIKQGETLIFFLSACHTDARYFSDPYTFKLHRFADPDVESEAYAPFGKGPHTCIGAGLSNIILPLNLATILKFADFKYEGNIADLALDYTKPSLSLDPDFSLSITPLAHNPTA
ncbi:MULTISPECIES: cytochrome P450 [Pseudoalteromonas]|uniref:Cytochrome P450 n=1 Tax=Pseudoalteromonas obscura TaxID=3048491 RepID=A0ABT7ETK4_9GAMM|nr:cytochrome P450 [Pseudoalteromonas sp. P94(2023)]MBQ4839753.1 cytochrome P450 [Pseudoalteromonas luteoviolacea]MDK2598391.1 cytochrome P450 [Pseudoalteromonas sp. P94(2023)]